MVCQKCGNEYDDNLRCCFKCGTLNPNNSDNIKNKATKSMLHTQQKELNKYKSNSFFNSYSFYNKKQGKRQVSFLNNIPLYILVNIIVFTISLIGYGNLLKYINIDINSFSFFFYSLIIMCYLICFQFIFDKANRTWWTVFIPIYNLGVFFKITFDDIKLLFITIVLPFVPKISIIVFKYLNIESLVSNTFLPSIYIVCNSFLILIYILSMFNFSKKFKSNSFLTVIFGFVMIPFIAFQRKYTYDNTI